MQIPSTASYTSRLEFLALTAATVSRRFIGLSLVSGLVWVVLGLCESLSLPGFSQPSLLHLALTGCIFGAVCSLIYRAVPRMANDRLSSLHAGLAGSASALTVIAVPLMAQSVPVAGAVIVATFVIHLAGLSVFGVLVARYF